jgi:hypothetical protein
MPTATVVILDPINKDNNVAARMTESDRNLIASTAESSWETLVTAQHNSYKGETCDLWREVFGSSFTIEAEAAAA